MRDGQPHFQTVDWRLVSVLLCRRLGSPFDCCVEHLTLKLVVIDDIKPTYDRMLVRIFGIFGILQCFSSPACRWGRSSPASGCKTGTSACAHHLLINVHRCLALPLPTGRCHALGRRQCGRSRWPAQGRQQGGSGSSCACCACSAATGPTGSAAGRQGKRSGDKAVHSGRRAAAAPTRAQKMSVRVTMPTQAPASSTMGTRWILCCRGRGQRQSQEQGSLKLAAGARARNAVVAPIRAALHAPLQTK